MPLTHFAVSRGSAAADISLKPGTGGNTGNFCTQHCQLYNARNDACHGLLDPVIEEKTRPRGRELPSFLFRSCNDYTCLPNDAENPLTGSLSAGYFDAAKRREH